MKTELYLIHALTNMHVGSGDINYDIIDRQVQKDPVTKIPVIHASSLKGAYREAAGEESRYTKYIFGPAPASGDEERQTGAFVFFEALMIARPVRSNAHPYYMATSPGILRRLLQTVDDFAIAIDETLVKNLKKLADLSPQNGTPLIFDHHDTPVYLETLQNPAQSNDTALSEEIGKLLGKPLALLSDHDFAALPLPVIARNQLENGISQNLWYEEVVPKESRFCFALGKPDKLSEEDRERIEKFEERFGNLHTMQFGANRSIGYGFCKVTKVSS
jgi:CRISPR-associated protein Cmr4